MLWTDVPFARIAVPYMILSILLSNRESFGAEVAVEGVLVVKAVRRLESLLHERVALEKMMSLVTQLAVRANKVISTRFASRQFLVREIFPEHISASFAKRFRRYRNQMRGLCSAYQLRLTRAFEAVHANFTKLTLIAISSLTFR